MKNKNLPSLINIVSPSEEPVTLAEAKLYLRVDNIDEDTLINQIIKTARISAEKYIGKSLITQQWRLSFDKYAPMEVYLRRGPIQTVDSVKFFDKNSNETILSSNQYSLSVDNRKLIFEITPLSNSIEINYTAGYGLSASVPNDIKQGMLIHIAQLYENRPFNTALQNRSRDLYFPYKELRL